MKERELSDVARSRRPSHSDTLTSFVTVEKRAVQPSQIAAGTRYVGLENIESATGVVSSTIVEAGELRSTKSLFIDGDILFGKLRPGLRKTAVATFDGVCSTEIVVLRPKRLGIAYTIALQLRSETMMPHFERLVAGANLPRLSVRDLSQLPIHLPTDAGSLRMLETQAKTLVQIRNLSHQLSSELEELEGALMAQFR